MKWIPTELHTHTIHSDGIFTVPRLCACAKLHGYEMIALTDHNTLSGLEELSKEFDVAKTRLVKAKLTVDYKLDRGAEDEN